MMALAHAMTAQPEACSWGVSCRPPCSPDSSQAQSGLSTPVSSASTRSLEDLVSGMNAHDIKKLLSEKFGLEVKQKVAEKQNKDRQPCPICLKILPQMPKNSPFCYPHKQTVESAKAQAEEDGVQALETFKEKATEPSSLTFRKLI